MRVLPSDLDYAFRQLRKTPGFTNGSSRPIALLDPLSAHSGPATSRWSRRTTLIGAVVLTLGIAKAMC